MSCLASFRPRTDRASGDYLVIREAEYLGTFTHHTLKMTGRFESRRRNQKAKTYKTRRAAVRATKGLPAVLPSPAGATCIYFVMTAQEWDEFIGVWDSTLNAPVVVRYRDCNINLNTGKIYRAA